MYTYPSVCLAGPNLSSKKKSIFCWRNIVNSSRLTQIYWNIKHNETFTTLINNCSSSSLFWKIYKCLNKWKESVSISVFVLTNVWKMSNAFVNLPQILFSVNLGITSLNDMILSALVSDISKRLFKLSTKFKDSRLE